MLYEIRLQYGTINDTGPARYQAVIQHFQAADKSVSLSAMTDSIRLRSGVSLHCPHQRGYI